MIHEIGKELQAELRTRGCPIQVFDGPERTQTVTFARERIVIEYGTGFKFGPVVSQHINPKHRQSLDIPGKITVYAQSPSAGALEFEHRRRALLIVRMVVASLDKVLRARKNMPTFVSGDFAQPSDLDKSESAGGTAFELIFSFETSVPDMTWAGDAQPEWALTNATSTTSIRFTNGADSAAETACGG